MSQQSHLGSVTGSKRKRSCSETTPVEMLLGNAPFRWSELPTELKLNVLGHALVFDKPITPYVHLMHSMNRLLPLALTNKEMCIMAMELYYAKNHFVVQSVRYSDPMHNLSYPNPMVGHWIQDLTLKLGFMSEYDKYSWKHDVFSPSGQWKFLLKCNKFGPESDLGAEWYNKLKLNNLKVIVELSGEICFMEQRWKNRTLDFCHRTAIWGLRHAHIAAKAKNYTFEVKGMQCMKEDGTSLCNGACSKIIEDVLRAMVLT
ncbi:hypothetical protein P3342_003786 [Pyrenophora teres f. teres]|uniref:Uncharacterized protein n=1 Tax=Pyrenophora teres f. teres TaxID=97479 RepID=A0A6S6VWQ4_9PLEO|nr:hypothetical protein PTNB29_00989 [Pyrenophora teres f. teres]KAK1915971.1 hypothetical protein P3342_003786 [Pyrenophora teres f. teres]CAE7013486.1 hypothetical protein PTTW11_02514 [Pyrenophora teres f. teres]